MKPFRHKTGYWVVQWSTKLSPTGRRSQSYYKTETAAQQAIDKRLKEWAKEGRRYITDEERDAVMMARRYLDGNLGKLGEVLEHWRKTGPTAITPTTVKKAVDQFERFRLERVSRRSMEDIQYQMRAFVREFGTMELHQITPGDLERWTYGAVGWTSRNRYKRLRQFMAWATRHRMVSENPMERLPPPEIPAGSKEIYSGGQLFNLLTHASVASDEIPWLLPFLALSAFAFMRTSEIIAKYESEEVLRWSDFDWSTNTIHIREAVGKRTRRASGNERLIPLQSAAQSWLADYRGITESGPVVPMRAGPAGIITKKAFESCNVPRIHNGLRRSAISYYLAVHPETGIGQLARWAGNSESVIRKHYLRFIRPEQGAAWFRTMRTPDGKPNMETIWELIQEDAEKFRRGEELD